MQCWAPVGDDDTRFLLGDHKGGLHLLLVAHDDGNAIVSLSLRRVGTTSMGSCLSYLDSGVCFVGSLCANSQLIKLHAEPLDRATPDNFVQARLLQACVCHRCCQLRRCIPDGKLQPLRALACTPVRAARFDMPKIC